MNNSLEELGNEDIMIEQLAETAPEQAKQYNLSNLYGLKNPNARSTRKGFSRSSASRNVIYNALGFKNPLIRQQARHINMPEQGTISHVQAPTKHHAMRSISPKPKKLGGRRLKLRTRRRRARRN